MAHNGRPKDLSQAGEGHLVGIAAGGHSLEVQDEEGKSVLVSRRQLCYSLEDGGQTILICLTL